MSFQTNVHVPDDLADPFGDEPWAEYDGSESLTTASDVTEVIDPTEELLEELESQLDSVTLDAQTIVTRQPRATQVQLGADTRKLFGEYKQHGSMSRLLVGIQKIFRFSDGRGKLKFEVLDAVNGMGTANSTPGHFGEAFMVNTVPTGDEYDVEPQKDYSASSYGADSLPQGRPYDHPLRIVDAESIEYVTTFPWDPVATILSWPTSLEWPRGLLSRINQILSIVDLESRVRLFHHVTKYGPSPLFRVGIAELVQSQYSSIFQDTHDHYLSLTPDTRSFLRELFETKNQLNAAECRMLVRACRVSEESIRIFWEDLSVARKGHNAMKVFVMAREVEKGNAARRDRARARARARGTEARGA